MTKIREHIPRVIRDRVLNEFNHRCAMCGTERPQIHHIDEDPSNNEPINLIPLCPNCHLTDQHNPTREIEPAKLKLFREYKDPTILKPQFHPLFIRLKFVDIIKDDFDAEELDLQAKELIEFVEELEMGSFYAKRLSELIRKPRYAGVWSSGDPSAEHRRRQAQQKYAQEYRLQLRNGRDKVYALTVELLRFQSW